ncbi:spore germination protein [Peribacillus simplex]|uniref:spore germination protein n=1 Tax=Peribacillus simplex TaxID=1478 RepID=UPI000BA5113F|nr:spore germination protein [Peribacillus simplex]PAK36776.1 spore germination protein [Peribacillus simplex]
MINFHSRKKKSKIEENIEKENVIFSCDLQENSTYLKTIFSYPDNSDLGVRPIHMPSQNKDALVFFMRGMVDATLIDHAISSLQEKEIQIVVGEDLTEVISKTILTGNQVSTLIERKEAVSALLDGQTIILMEGSSSVLSLQTAKYDGRSVDKPQSENVIKGSNEAFVESGTVNISLIRKRLRDESLVTETLYIGHDKKTKISLMFLKNVMDPDLLHQIKDRVTQIDVDYIEDVSVLEQHMEERAYSLVPTILYTERPDRATSFIREGNVILIMENSPAALVAPATFWSFFHTSEDYYLRWAYGNFIRMIRLLSVFIALFTPSLYVAVVNFHSAMIPTDLLLAIAATRETVPFPVIIEIIMMELAFEILREAGIRIPTPMGSTIGIVGALILGQAAVDANIISPILVIVVSITGLASFAIPNVSFSFAVRIMRFALLIFASFMGLFGVMMATIMCVAYLSTLTSFGVPYLAPTIPFFPSSKDTIGRKVSWKERIKPMYLHPKKATENSKTKGKRGL